MFRNKIDISGKGRLHINETIVGLSIDKPMASVPTGHLELIIPLCGSLVKS